MNKLFLSLGLTTLLFAMGCGSSSSSGPTPTGNFSNSSLNGQYAYQLSGFDLGTGNPYTRAGVFTANGAGVITSGTDDFTEGTLATTATSGTYSISNDGTGTLVLTFPTGQLQWAMTIQASATTSAPKVYLIETSSTPTGGSTPFTGSGVAEGQNSAAFAGPPSGAFVFRAHTYFINSSSITPQSAVGAVTIAGGAATGGNEDVNTLGSNLSSPVITGGVFNAPDSTGRGSGSITNNSPSTTTFQYYVIDSSHLNILITTGGAVGLGRAEMQTGTFSNASLMGSYAFGSRGDTGNNLLGVHTVGLFTANGSGGLTAFNFDAMKDGTSTSNGSLSNNTYTVGSNGRAVVSLNSSAATQIFWLVNSSHIFLLPSDPTVAVDGTADLQTTSSFSNGTISGQFAFLNDGVQLVSTGNGTVDRVATLQWNGSGGLTLNEFINVSGSTNVPGFLSGSYSVGSNGRVTGKISGSLNSVNLVFYMVSGSQGYVLENDPNTAVSGFTQLQQ
ncbi:MAG TPA: hypothetical protein VKB77_02910 [Terriglobales bacterium]|nr:hypothetical protein [Terriglobales bacterium]